MNVLPDNILAGLSTRGGLYFWQMPEARLIHQMKVPVPPPISGLVKMLYWSEKHTLVCPDSEGEMTLIDITSMVPTELEAHDGPFYAISSRCDDFLTVGMKDGLLRLWSTDSDRPIATYPVKKGMISAATTMTAPNRIFLIDSKGTISAYKLSREKIHPVYQSMDKAYRIFDVDGQERLKQFHDKQNRINVQRIIKKIVRKTGHVPDDAIESYHMELSKMGFRHVSLALMANQAVEEQDIVKGLGIYKELLDILPQDEPGTYVSLERYAELLSKVYLYREANAIGKRILRACPDFYFSIDMQNIGYRSKRFNGNHWIVRPEIKIEDLISSATVIRKQFSGRYVINSLKPKQCTKTILSPQSIANKYEILRNETQNKTMPPSKIEQVCLMTGSQNDQVDIITFDKNHSGGHEGLAFSLLVTGGQFPTVVTPMVLFDWPNLGSNKHFEEENAKAAKALSIIRNKSSSFTYLSEIHAVVITALRRLITQSNSTWDTEKWIA